MILEKIKELCEQHNTTIKQLEVSTGIANGVIRKWDLVSPRLEYVKKVADYFGVTVDYLLGGEYVPRSLDDKVPEIAKAQRNELAHKAVELLAEMPPEMQQAAIAQLEALAALNKK